MKEINYFASIALRIAEKIPQVCRLGKTRNCSEKPGLNQATAGKKTIEPHTGIYEVSIALSNVR